MSGWPAPPGVRPDAPRGLRAPHLAPESHPLRPDAPQLAPDAHPLAPDAPRTPPGAPPLAADASLGPDAPLGLDAPKGAEARAPLAPEGPPVVALDGREFVLGRQTGIGRYLASLVAHARRQPPAWQLEVVAPPGCAPPDGAPARQIGTADGWRWDWVEAPRHLRGRGAAVWMTPYVKFRPTGAYRIVAIVCDPTDLLPEVGARRPVVRLVRRILVRRAAARVTISGWSRDQLARILRVPPESFRVIPPGVAAPEPAVAPATAGGYVLHLSNGKPHKNVEGLVAAYAALAAPLRAAHPLVLAGVHEHQRPAVEGALGRHGLGPDRVRLLGHVAETALPGLYAGAALFVFPSLAEGFGIPPLEAMARGVPVVASTAGALPETLGDAALLVDPRDGPGLREAMAAALADRSLRAQLAERGRARARAFPAERTGGLLAALVDDVMRGAA
jgi:glycosyltransferase involved in cell wall biosynthesis